MGRPEAMASKSFKGEVKSLAVVESRSGITKSRLSLSRRRDREAERIRGRTVRERLEDLQPIEVGSAEACRR
jgi:hypothetical protein